jgi:hypothetical protein
VAVNKGNSSRIGAVRDRVQIRNPVTGKYIKLDTRTGRILDEKKSEGPYKGVRDVSEKR